MKFGDLQEENKQTNKQTNGYCVSAERVIQISLTTSWTRMVSAGILRVKMGGYLFTL